MRTLTREITVRSPARLRCLDLTGTLRSVVNEAGIEEGCVVAFCAHTTCSLMVNEWEAGVLEDLQGTLERLFPADTYYAHDDLARRTQNLVEEERRNGHAHVAQMVMGGSSHAVPVSGGAPMLGRWQRLILIELDEPQDRRVLFHAFGVAGSDSTQSLVTNSQKARPAYSP